MFWFHHDFCGEGLERVGKAGKIHVLLNCEIYLLLRTQ